MGIFGSGDKAKVPDVYKDLTRIGKRTGWRMEAAQESGSPLWNVPDMPNAPMMNVLSPFLPTTGWYGSLDPNVRAGIMEPYMDIQEQLMETLGSQGQMGSARGGYSGSMGAALGRFWGEAAPTIGQQAWGMVYPQMAQYRQELMQAPYQQAMLNYQGGLTQQGQMLQSLAAPYTQLPGILGGTSSVLPPTTVQSNPFSFGGLASGGLMGALAGGMLPTGAQDAFGGAGAAMGLGALLGGLGGAFGGLF